MQATARAGLRVDDRPRQLGPGQRVLELAAGPGDTGFMAARLIEPGGTLICSDAVAGMLDVARERAEEQGIDNVEFKQLQLEWIDLPTASVDVVLCRWGVMLTRRSRHGAARVSPRAQTGRSAGARGLGRARGEPVGDDSGCGADRARALAATGSGLTRHVRVGRSGQAH